jgi:hypothetical protein
MMRRREAVARLGAVSLDTIVSDIDMPYMIGLHFLLAIGFGEQAMHLRGLRSVEPSRGRNQFERCRLRHHGGAAKPLRFRATFLVHRCAMQRLNDLFQ